MVTNTKCDNPSCSKEGYEYNSKFSKCSKCKSVFYCSRECQITHWKGGVGPSGKWGHRNECKKKIIVPESLAGESKAEESNTVHLEEEFKCRPCDLYSAFTNPKDVKMYTHAAAEANVIQGGAFSYFEGSIYGKYIEIEENARVLCKWKNKSWGKGVYSICELTFTELEEGLTKLVIHQTGVPIQDGFGYPGVIESTTDGWKNHFFQNIYTVLGYAYDKN